MANTNGSASKEALLAEALERQAALEKQVTFLSAELQKVRDGVRPSVVCRNCAAEWEPRTHHPDGPVQCPRCGVRLRRPKSREEVEVEDASE
jgi:DNA-directed RNA polymerase subunit RPC12/RpoP